MTSETQKPNLDILKKWKQGDFTYDCKEFVFMSKSANHQKNFKFLTCKDSEGFVVISQTCDIVRDPSDIPLVSVCPLIEVNATTYSNLKKGKAPKLGFLQNLGENKAVDFSRTMSVTKELLMTWVHHTGCKSDTQSMLFARAIENVYGRFAYPDCFVASLRNFRNSIFDKHPKNNKKGEILQSISEIRVIPHAPWGNKKSIPITFLVILDNENERVILDRSEIKTEILTYINSIDWKGPFNIHSDILLLAEKYEISLDIYENSYPIDFNFVSFSGLRGMLN